MADSKLRLQITTALDNAGIKATKEQIAALEKSLGKMSDKGTTGLQGLEKQLGGIKGPLGKLAPMFEGMSGAISKFGVAATAVIGAFKAGWDIGDWIQTHVIDKLFGIKEPLEEIKQKNKALQKEHEQTLKQLEYQATVSDNAYNNAIQGIDQEAQHIDKLNAAWQKAARAKLSYQNADMDIETQQLERHRFEDVMRLQNEGDLEGAEQANKLYDVYKAIMQAQNEIAKYDQETALIEQGLLQTAEKRDKILDKIVAAEKDVREKDKEKERIENTATSADEYNRLMLRANQKHYAATMRLKRAEDELEAFDASDNGAIELATRQKQRAVLADRLMLGVDQAAWTYDQHITTNGNALNLQFQEEFTAALAETSKQTSADLVKAITIGVAQGIGQLLEVK